MLTLSTLIPNRLKGYFSKKSSPANTSPTGTEYSFVWYFKMQVKPKSKDGVTSIKSSFTMPCRTTITAGSYEEAKEKLTQFALGKCELKIWEEKEYLKSELGKNDKSLADEFEKLNQIFSKF